MDSANMIFSGWKPGNYACQLSNVVYVEVDKFFFVKIHLYYKNPRYDPRIGNSYRLNSEYTYTKFEFFDVRGPFSPIYRYIKSMFLKHKVHEENKARIVLMENVNQALNLCGLKLEKDLLSGGRK